MDDDTSSVPPESRDGLPLHSTSSDNGDQERISQLQEKIFGNVPILQEIILNCLLHTVNSEDDVNEASLSSSVARNLRLVNRTWRKETNKIFLKNNKPLFSLAIFHSTPLFGLGLHYRHELYEEIRSKCMVKYLDFLSSFLDHSLEKPPPPFSLSIIIQEPFLYPLDIWYMQNITRNPSLISALVKLTIDDNEQPRGMSHNCCPKIPSDLKLPCLQEVNIYYKTEIPANDKFLTFIKAIVNAASSLKKLTLKVEVANLNETIDWILPITLTHLSIYSKCILPRLRTPNQSKPTSPPISLPKLKLLQVYRSGGPLIGIPDIVALTKLVSTMPKLQILKLTDILESELKNVWCHPDLKNWPTVTSLVSKLKPSSHEYMTSIHRSFPSLTHLDLTILLIISPFITTFEQWTSQLRYLFQGMTQLKSLKLSLVKMPYHKEFIMDSILLGTTPEKATQLRQDQTLWDNFLKEGQDGDLNEQTQCGGGIGIKNFRNLTSLHLSCSAKYTPPFGSLKVPPPIASPLIFRLGFMQLPKLENLILEGGFSVGMQDIGNEWLKQSAARTLQVISSVSNDNEDDEYDDDYAYDTDNNDDDDS